MSAKLDKGWDVGMADVGKMLVYCTWLTPVAKAKAKDNDRVMRWHASCSVSCFSLLICSGCTSGLLTRRLDSSSADSVILMYCLNTIRSRPPSFLALVYVLKGWRRRAPACLSSLPFPSLLSFLHSFPLSFKVARLVVLFLSFPFPSFPSHT
jgi:hypothetical protein